MWANVHVEDLSDCFLKLVEAAAFGGGTATWNQEGYYFTENGEHVWSDMSKLISKDAHKKGRSPLSKAYTTKSNPPLSISGVGVKEPYETVSRSFPINPCHAVVYCRLARNSRVLIRVIH